MLKIYSIRDSKGGVFNQPFLAKTPSEAERSFKRLTNDPQSMVCQFPDDFDLYQLGEFDEETGKIKSLDTPHHVLKAVQVKEQLKALN